MVALPGTAILYPIATQDNPRLSHISTIITHSNPPSYPPFHTLQLTYSSTSILPPSQCVYTVLVRSGSESTLRHIYSTHNNNHPQHSQIHQSCSKCRHIRQYPRHGSPNRCRGSSHRSGMVRLRVIKNTSNPVYPPLLHH